MADPLKFKVYAAQSWVTGSQKFTSVKDAAAFIRWCERDVRFRDLHPGYEPVKAVYRLKDQAAPSAFYRWKNHSIYLPYWGQDAVHLVHELTHATRPDGPSHGAEFVRAFHEHVRLFLSEAQAAQLRLGLEQNGIRALAYDSRGALLKDLRKTSP